MRSDNEPPRVVVDTNLVVSGLLNPFGAPAQLIVARRRGEFTLLVTDQLRAEYERVLVRPRLARRYGLSSDAVATFLRQLHARGVMAAAVGTLPVQVRDEKDEPVLAAALGGNAAYLVTGDDDLLVLNGDPKLGSLQISTVRAFLAAMGALERVMDFGRERRHAGALRKPKATRCNSAKISWEGRKVPAPRSIARFNRRFTNRLALRVAGYLPGFAIVSHVGRKSGRAYRTPVNAFPTDGGYIIALTYGSESDWVKNVLAAGSCELQTRGRRVRLFNPDIHTDQSKGWAPLPVKLILDLIHAPQYMRLSL